MVNNRQGRIRSLLVRCTVLALLSSLTMVSCVPKASTQPTPIAPTKPLPKRTEAPNLAPVVKRIGEMREQNVELQGEISWYRDKNIDLTKNLRRLEIVGVATKEELTAVREKSETMELDLQRVTGIVTHQRESISQLAADIVEKSNQVSSISQERDTLRISLQAANTDLGSLTLENKAVKSEGDLARNKLIEVNTELKSERRWKWRFFWITLALVAILVGSWGTYGYIKLKSPL